jgi:hypothetical protein
MKNPELARLVLKQVQAHPETFEMGVWGMREECGTVACLAGWAMVFSGYELRQVPLPPYARPEQPGDTWAFFRPDGTWVEEDEWEGRHLLGLSDEEYRDGFGVELFYDDPEGALTRLQELIAASEAGTG